MTVLNGQVRTPVKKNGDLSGGLVEHRLPPCSDGFLPSLAVHVGHRVMSQRAFEDKVGVRILRWKFAASHREKRPDNKGILPSFPSMDAAGP